MAAAANEVAMMIQSLNVMLDPIMEASQGYMEKAKAHGFDESSASRMGADYHGVLCEIIKNNALGKKK